MGIHTAYDLTKSLQTRGGCEVKVLMDNGGGLYPIIGAFRNDQDVWVPCSWNKEGHSSDEASDKHLEYKRERFFLVEYINVYRNTETGDVFIKETVRCKTREEADQYNLNGREHIERIACKKVVIEGTEGEFDA